MLEGLISSVLNRYLSSVVQLDRDQLVVGVWSGRLHLTQLSIRPSLFASLPFALVRGGDRLLRAAAELGEDELRCPWQIVIRDVHVLLRPQRTAEGREAWERPPTQWTAKEVEEWMEHEKQRVLDEAFAASAALFSAREEEAGGGAASFAATFLASRRRQRPAGSRGTRPRARGGGRERTSTSQRRTRSTNAAMSSTPAMPSTLQTRLWKPSPTTASTPPSRETAATSPRLHLPAALSEAPLTLPDPSLSSSVLVSRSHELFPPALRVRCGAAVAVD